MSFWSTFDSFIKVTLRVFLTQTLLNYAYYLFETVQNLCCFHSLTIFWKCSILDIWLGSDHIWSFLSFFIFSFFILFRQNNIELRKSKRNLLHLYCRFYINNFPGCSKLLRSTEAYWEPSQISTMRLHVKIVNDWK